MPSVYIYIIEHFYPRILKYTIFINISLKKITDRDSFDDHWHFKWTICLPLAVTGTHTVWLISREFHIPEKRINYK